MQDYKKVAAMGGQGFAVSLVIFPQPPIGAQRKTTGFKYASKPIEL